MPDDVKPWKWHVEQYGDSSDYKWLGDVDGPVLRPTCDIAGDCSIDVSDGHAALIAAAPAMYALLKNLEWSEEKEEFTSFCDEPPTPSGDYYSCCPVCGGAEKIGHRETCRLAAILKEIDNVQ